MFEVTRAYTDHLENVVERAENGDLDAVRTLGCVALLLDGWVPGDPDPSNDPGPDGGNVIELRKFIMDRAA